MTPQSTKTNVFKTSIPPDPEIKEQVHQATLILQNGWKEAEADLIHRAIECFGHPRACVFKADINNLDIRHLIFEYSDGRQVVVGEIAQKFRDNKITITTKTMHEPVNPFQDHEQESERVIEKIKSATSFGAVSMREWSPSGVEGVEIRMGDNAWKPQEGTARLMAHGWRINYEEPSYMGQIYARFSSSTTKEEQPSIGEAADPASEKQSHVWNVTGIQEAQWKAVSLLIKTLSDRTRSMSQEDAEVGLQALGQLLKPHLRD